MRTRLWAVALLGLACSEQGPVALVRVLGVPPSATTLEAHFQLGARSAMAPQIWSAPAGGFGAETSFVVVLPKGSTGLLGVELWARDTGGCTLASGSAVRALAGDARVDFTVELSASTAFCGGDGGSDGSFDAQPDALRPGEVVHVPEQGAYVGTAPLNLGTTTIDTTSLTIEGVPLPSGVSFDVWPQAPSGPELAVLHVRRLDVAPGATVRVVGARPLVVISDRDITLGGTLDASAREQAPGAGGGARAAGPGAGGPGMHTGLYSDSGGGGAGFGRAGAVGGHASGEGLTAVGGSGGLPYGDPLLAVLQGGSGGGAGNPGSCSSASGGAGGGAVQLYSRMQIQITTSGGINLGGGGGAGAISCGLGNSGAGSGGGSGGALFLQAPFVLNDGTLAANGGGGGGGAGVQTGAGTGQDGLLGRQAASGGSSGGAQGAQGGAGGVGATDARMGGNLDSPSGGNGGGGGGAVGRIRVITQSGFSGGGIVSPDPSVGSY